MKIMTSRVLYQLINCVGKKYTSLNGKLDVKILKQLKLKENITVNISRIQ